MGGASAKLDAEVQVSDVVLRERALQWFAAEMGRQPWVVYNLLRTSDALSKTVKAEQVLISLIMFTLVYATLLVLFLYLLNKKIKHGPDSEASAEDKEAESKSIRENPIMN